MALERDFSSAVPSTLHGGQIGMSYQGPIHYGMSSSSHPFRTDRQWKQTHAGLGYDIPLHELAPGSVNVRARSGPKGGLDIELETPFHRTDRSHLRGIEWSLEQAGLGFETTGDASPTGDILGQWFLRSNLWSKDASLHAAAGVDDISNVHDGDKGLHGPAVEQGVFTGASQRWEPYWWWDDHPTDHFHAGAVPIDIGNDYGGVYGDVYLGRADTTHPLDWIANSEQLQSSVDVHLNKAVKPVWDSGSIVSALGIGLRDTDQGGRIEAQMGAFYTEGDGAYQPPPERVPWSSAGGFVNTGHGLGLGQRIIRTNDGTLHQFVLQRSATQNQGANCYPSWVHHKKPLFGDLFWSSREHKDNAFGGSPPTWSGKDEVGPDISPLIIAGTIPQLRIHGAAFAADSIGTIHAIIEVCDSTNDGHSLYYHKAVRDLQSANPEPVYDWRWDLEAATRILGSGTGTEITFGEDFREPSLICDSNDTLHLTFIATDDNNTGGISSRVYYTQKRDDENWAAWDATVSVRATPRYQVVSYASTDTNDSTAPFPTPGADKPKLVLRGDNVPVVFFRGAHSWNGDASRRMPAVYANVGKNRAGTTGLYYFDEQGSYMAGGLPPAGGGATLSGHIDDGVAAYDVIIDERDIAWVVHLSTGDTSGTINGVGEPKPYLTRITTFDTRLSLTSQYSTTSGLGLSTTLFHAGGVAAPNLGLDAKLHSPTITTDGKGNIHVVMCSRYDQATSVVQGTGGADMMVGSPALRNVAPNTTEHAPYPLQMPGVKAGDQDTGGVAATSDSDEGGSGEHTSTLAAEVYGWPGWSGPFNTNAISHLFEMWWPAHEYSTPGSGEWVIRSMNFRWLSSPGMTFNPITGFFVPVGQSDTIAGHEDFLHTAPQLRGQRFHGYDSSYLDLAWITNERSWISTPHEGSRVYWPHGHPDGTPAEPGTDGWMSAEHRRGVPGYPVVDGP